MMCVCIDWLCIDTKAVSFGVKHTRVSVTGQLENVQEVWIIFGRIFGWEVDGIDS